MSLVWALKSTDLRSGFLVTEGLDGDSLDRHGTMWGGRGGRDIVNNDEMLRTERKGTQMQEQEVGESIEGKKKDRRGRERRRTNRERKRGGREVEGQLIQDGPRHSLINVPPLVHPHKCRFPP